MIYKEAKLVFERAYWSTVFLDCECSVTRLAQVSGVNRTDAYKRLQRAGIAPERRKMTTAKLRKLRFAKTASLTDAIRMLGRRTAKQD